jgi:hypothetical protein
MNTTFYNKIIVFSLETFPNLITKSITHLSQKTTNENILYFYFITTYLSPKVNV